VAVFEGDEVAVTIRIDLELDETNCDEVAKSATDVLVD
jgi:hypothetical protein